MFLFTPSMYASLDQGSRDQAAQKMTRLKRAKDNASDDASSIKKAMQDHDSWVRAQGWVLHWQTAMSKDDSGYICVRKGKRTRKK